MTQITASISALAHPGRVLATAALAALALSGYGSAKPGDGGARVGSDRKAAVAATASATAPSPEQTAFQAMLAKIAQSCPPAGVTAPKPTGPTAERNLAPGETPPADPIEPGAPTGPEAGLNDRDWCASTLHEQRIIEALQKVWEPTPAKVRKTLNGLGYIDERIHDLKQNGGTTRFYLDLRENGGRLCEAGVAAGKATDMTACTALAVGAFAVEQ